MSLRKILEELTDKSVNNILDFSTASGFKRDIDLAHQQILALIPKKKEGIIALLDKNGKKYYKTEQLPQAYWNEAIDEITHNLTKDV